MMLPLWFSQVRNSRSELQPIPAVRPLGQPANVVPPYSLIAAFLARVAVIQVPPLQGVCGANALSRSEWELLGVIAISVVVVVEVHKAVRRYLGLEPPVVPMPAGRGAN
jgi:hypothetical protein